MLILLIEKNNIFNLIIHKNTHKKKHALNFRAWDFW